MRVEEVAEDARAGGACFGACGQLSFAGALDTEGAFFHDAFGAFAVAEVVLFGVFGVVGDLWFVPVEASGPVGACGLAVAASDAPVVVDYDDAIGFFPGGADGADFDAGGVFALEALGAHVEVSFGGDLVVKCSIAVFDVEFAILQLEDADVLHVGALVEVVFFHAGFDAIHIALAFGDIEGVAVEDAFGRGFGADGGFGSPVLCAERLEACDGLFFFFVAHEAVVFLEVLVPLEA